MQSFWLSILSLQHNSDNFNENNLISEANYADLLTKTNCIKVEKNILKAMQINVEYI